MPLTPGMLHDILPDAVEYAVGHADLLEEMEPGLPEPRIP
jgi:hypothetical protein